MTASRRDYRRAVDWSAVADPNAIKNVIDGLLSRRRAMRESEICKWFYATPPAAIALALTDMCATGRIEGRATALRHRGKLEYSLPANAGWDT